MGPNKFTCFCTAKETTNKRLSTQWEKIFANDVTDMGLIYKIQTDQQLNMKKKFF